MKLQSDNGELSYTPIQRVLSSNVHDDIWTSYISYESPVVYFLVDGHDAHVVKDSSGHDDTLIRRLQFWKLLIPVSLHRQRSYTSERE